MGAYGADAVRYYFMAEIEFGKDGDFSEERFREKVLCEKHLCQELASADGHGQACAVVQTFGHSIGRLAMWQGKGVAHYVGISRSGNAVSTMLWLLRTARHAARCRLPHGITRLLLHAHRPPMIYQTVSRLDVA